MQAPVRSPLKRCSSAARTSSLLMAKAGVAQNMRKEKERSGALMVACDPASGARRSVQAGVLHALPAPDRVLPLEIILLVEVIADLHQHRDAFGIAGLCDDALLRLGAELPAVAVAENGDQDAIRAIGVNLQLGPGHCNQFGFGLGRLAHVTLSPRSFRFNHRLPF